MPLQWSTSDKEAFLHGIKVLAYGGPGTGKTHLCSTAPSPLIISAESGLLTLKRHKIPVLIVKTAQDVRDALNWCRTDAIRQGIKTICLDSASEICEKVLVDEKKKTADPRKAFGEMATMSLELLKDFRDLPGLNVFVTAKEALAQDPITGASKYRPDAPGSQIGPALPYLFDEVFHTFTDKEADGKPYWAFRTKATYNVIAKDRSGNLSEIEYPDLNYIFNKILEK